MIVLLADWQQPVQWVPGTRLLASTRSALSRKPHRPLTAVELQAKITLVNSEWRYLIAELAANKRIIRKAIEWSIAFIVDPLHDSISKRALIHSFEIRSKRLGIWEQSLFLYMTFCFLEDGSLLGGLGLQQLVWTLKFIREGWWFARWKIY